MAKYTSKCQRCGLDGLAWGLRGGKWRLYPALECDGQFQPDMSELPHTCLSGMARPVPATASQPAVSTIAAVPATPAVSQPAKPARKVKVLGVNAPWYEVMPVAWEAGARKILLVGPPGTGKTHTSKQLFNCGPYEMTMHQGKEAMEVEGYWTTEANPTGGVLTKWNDGAAVKAMKDGHPLLINEISFCPEQIMGMLYALADDNPTLRLSSGEMVTAKEGYGVIMTDNDNVGVLKEAIIDRVEVVIIAKTPHPAAVEHLPSELRALTVNYFKGLPAEPWEFACSPTVRRVRAYHRLVMAGTMTPELCAQLVFGKSGAEIISALSTASRTDGVQVIDGR